MPYVEYPPPKTVFCDVDGTLQTGDGRLNKSLVNLLQRYRDDGYTLVLWSARGAEYANEIANRHSVSQLFHLVIGKPGVLIDDLGEDFIQYAKVIRCAHLL